MNEEDKLKQQLGEIKETQENTYNYDQCLGEKTSSCQRSIFKSHIYFVILAVIVITPILLNIIGYIKQIPQINFKMFGPILIGILIACVILMIIFSSKRKKQGKKD